MQSQSEPWNRREAWSSSRLESQTGGRPPVLFLWAFAIVWNAFSWLAAIEAARGNATGDTELAPLFPAIGAAILALTIYVTLQHRKWGRSQLELLTRPGVLGGSLRCVLHASPALAQADALEVSLDCCGPEAAEGNFQLIGHLWHHEVRVPRSRFQLGAETRVPLDIRLPYGLPESQANRTGDDAVWLLRLHAKLPGIDFEASFDLPVFKTSESSPEEEGSRVEAPRLTSPPASGAVTALPGSKIRVRRYGTIGTEFVFGMFRNPWLGLFTCVITVLFCGMVTAIRYAEGPGFFLVAFSAATLILAYSSLDTLFGVTRVRVERGRIRVTHGPCGFGPTRTLELHEIERIRVTPCWASGSQTTSRIRIERRPRRPDASRWRRRVIAGTRIPTLAEALAEAMREGVGL